MSVPLETWARRWPELAALGPERMLVDLLKELAIAAPPQRQPIARSFVAFLTGSRIDPARGADLITRARQITPEHLQVDGIDPQLAALLQRRAALAEQVAALGGTVTVRQLIERRAELQQQVAEKRDTVFRQRSLIAEAERVCRAGWGDDQ